MNQQRVSRISNGAANIGYIGEFGIDEVCRKNSHLLCSARGERGGAENFIQSNTFSLSKKEVLSLPREMGRIPGHEVLLNSALTALILSCTTSTLTGTAIPLSVYGDLPAVKLFAMSPSGKSPASQKLPLGKTSSWHFG